VNPFLFASAITFLPFLNVSIDYEGQVPHNLQKQKTKRQKKESKYNAEEKPPCSSPLNASARNPNKRRENLLCIPPLALDGRGLG